LEVPTTRTCSNSQNWENGKAMTLRASSALFISLAHERVRIAVGSDTFLTVSTFRADPL
jgi:hypothetical protein